MLQSSGVRKGKRGLSELQEASGMKPRLLKKIRKNRAKKVKNKSRLDDDTSLVNEEKCKTCNRTFPRALSLASHVGFCRKEHEQNRLKESLRQLHSRGKI